MAMETKFYCRTHEWPLFTVESVMNLVKYYPMPRKTAESNDCGRITVTNIEIFASFANNSSACCAPCLIPGTTDSVMIIGLSISGCWNSKIKSCVTSENRNLGCSDLKNFTWFRQILLFSSSLKKTKGGSDHRLIVSLLRTFDCIVVKVVFLYICLRCVQGRTLIFKAKR